MTDRSPSVQSFWRDDPAGSAGTGYRDPHELDREHREWEALRLERQREHAPAPCTSCSPMYRVGLVRCPGCGNWRRP